MEIAGILVTPVLPTFLNPDSGRAGDGFRPISSPLAAMFIEEGETEEVELSKMPLTELEPTGIAWVPVGEADNIEAFLGPASLTCSWVVSPC
ncbi:hypothetical protein HanPSC8_Chr13g0560301 [Helianthus annuus]|nr:hypothetical protein HanIR_Chr13g0633781 [Helianthus annuus]KAJ0848678.1 hypothetical protein HanPSC8_Chr13g0560301 [Helianthus annuus]